MSRDMLNDQELETLFAAERVDNPVPDVLMARILADAADTQEKLATQTRVQKTPRRWLSWEWALPGTAMATCLCAGVFIGLSTDITDTFGITTLTDQSFTQALGGSGFESLFEEDQS